MGSFGEFEKLQMPLTFLQEPRPDLVHVGLVLLSSDHSLEMEWSKLLSDQVLTFNSRVHHNGLLDAHDLSQISQGIVDTTNLIATGLEMDVMAFACTSASIVIGETKISNLLTHNRKNIPSTNPWTAAKTAFNYLKAKNIAVFSPYPTKTNYLLYSSLIKAGFNVSSFGSLGIENDKFVTTISKDSMFKALEKILKGQQVDVVFMSCTNLRALKHLEEFENYFGVPIVTSNSALFWHVMHIAGKTAKCPGYGILLNYLE